MASSYVAPPSALSSTTKRAGAASHTKARRSTRTAPCSASVSADEPAGAGKTPDVRLESSATRVPALIDAAVGLAPKYGVASSAWLVAFASVAAAAAAPPPALKSWQLSRRGAAAALTLTLTLHGVTLLAEAGAMVVLGSMWTTVSAGSVPLAALSKPSACRVPLPSTPAKTSVTSSPATQPGCAATSRSSGVRSALASSACARYHCCTSQCTTASLRLCSAPMWKDLLPTPSRSAAPSETDPPAPSAPPPPGRPITARTATVSGSGPDEARAVMLAKASETAERGGNGTARKRSANALPLASVSNCELARHGSSVRHKTL